MDFRRKKFEDQICQGRQGDLLNPVGVKMSSIFSSLSRAIWALFMSSGAHMRHHPLCHANIFVDDESAGGELAQKLMVERFHRFL